MSEEKKLENMELNDEDLMDVSGGLSARFTCNDCHQEVTCNCDRGGTFRIK